MKEKGRVRRERAVYSVLFIVCIIIFRDGENRQMKGEGLKGRDRKEEEW